MANRAKNHEEKALQLSKSSKTMPSILTNMTVMADLVELQHESHGVNCKVVEFEMIFITILN